jgi:hypothetical protein
VKRLSEAERDGLALEAQQRSGSDIVLEYPVPAAGTHIYLCRLGNDDFRDVVDAGMSGDKARRDTARNVALAAARLAPSQRELADACAAIPDLDVALWSAVERLGGGNTDFLQVVDVRPTLDASAVAELGIDPARLDELRKRYPHPGQLKIARYRDDEMGIAWAAVLKLPASQSTKLMLEGMAERGHEVAVTFAINSIVEPAREQVAAFVRGEYRIASCLWPTLFMWAKTAAQARPTILRPRSTPSETSTPPQT